MSQLLRGGGCWISSAGVSWEGFQLSLTCHLLLEKSLGFCSSATLPVQGAGLAGKAAGSQQREEQSWDLFTHGKDRWLPSSAVPSAEGAGRE